MAPDSNPATPAAGANTAATASTTPATPAAGANTAATASTTPATPAAANAPAPSGQTVSIPMPAAGANVSVQSSPSGKLEFSAFNPGEATATRSENSLVFEVDGGGKVTVENFFAVGNQSLPDLVVDGMVVAAADFFTGSGLDMTTAAGPGAGRAPGSGGTNYDDDAGNLLNGLDRLGSLGTDYWGRDTEVPSAELGRIYPSGTFIVGVGTNLNGAFQSVVYEDGQPEQHVGDTSLHAGQLLLTVNPGTTSTVGEITLSNFPQGAQLYLGDPANGGVLLTADALGVYRFTEGDFTGAGVYLIPPKDSDGDFTVTATVAFSTDGTTSILTGTFTVLVDAVADKPFDVSAILLDDGSNAHDMTHTVTQSQSTNSGYDTTNYAVTATPTEASVAVNLQVTATFGDFADGSEQHFALVEQLPGFTGAYATIDVGGVTYFKIPVDNTTIAAGNGTVTVDVTLNTTSVTADTTFTVQTGALAEETPSDGELRTDNNTAVTLDQATTDFTVDVINSSLTLQVGWASEGNNDGKHTAAGTAGDYTPNYAGLGVDAASTSNVGAPVTLSLSGASGSAEVITSVVFTYDATQGALNYTGAGTVTVTGSGVNTTVTITGATPGADLGTSLGNDLHYVPAAGSFSDADVHLDYKVTVENAKGATATFGGSSTIVVDAVADKSSAVDSLVNGDVNHTNTVPQETVTVSGTDETAPNATTGWETDTYANGYAPTTGYSLSVNVQTTFADLDGSEKHYVLIEQPTPDWALGTLPAGYTSAETHTGADGKTYFKIEVADATQGTVNVNIPLVAPANFGANGDDSVSLKTGSLAVEQKPVGAGEYDAANNEAERLAVTAVTYTVDVINSELTVKTGWGSEGNNDGKHTAAGTNSSHRYTGTQAGSTSDGSAPIQLSIAGASGFAEVITSVVFTYDATQGALNYTGAGTVTVTGSGVNTTVTITGATPGADLGTSLGNDLHYVPAAGSFSDADVNLSYKVTVENAKGATATFGGSSTIVVDAVADMSSAVDSLVNGDVNHTNTVPQGTVTVSGTDETAPNATTGWETDTYANGYAPTTGYSLSVNVQTTFADLDGSEKHYVLIEQPTPDWALGTLPAGYTSAGTHTDADGKTYFKIEVTDPTQGTVNVDIPLVAPANFGANGDDSVSLKTGSLAVEQKPVGAGEYDAANNEAERLAVTAVTYTVDVINSELTVKTGWGSEGNNDGKHTGATTGASYTPSYPGLGVASESTGIHSSDHTNIGAPILVSIAGASGFAEVITSVVFTYDSTQGALNYTGAGTVTVTGSGTNTTVTITGATPGADLGTSLGNDLHYVPAAGSFSDADVNLSYKVTVENAKGATATFGGSSTIVVDAVADMSSAVDSLVNGDVNHTNTVPQGTVTVSGTDETAPNATTGWETDTYANGYAPTTGYSLSVNVQTTFADLDGSEKHYVLIEQPTPDWALGTLPAGYTSAGTHTDADGKTYFKIEVTDPTQGTVNVDIPLVAPANFGANGDDSVSLKTGSLAVEQKPVGAGEYDAANNEAERLAVTAVTYTVDVINSELTVKTGWASEGNNDGKHTAAGTNSSHTYTGTQAGSTSDGSAPIQLSLSGASGSDEVITSVVFTFDDSRGSLWFNATEYHSGQSIPVGTATPKDLVFKPAAGSFSDADVNLSYTVTVTNVNVNAATATYKGSSTIVVDAVADKPVVAIATDGSQVDYHENIIGGTPTEQVAAKPGESVTLHSTVSFPDASGGENHFVLVQQLAGVTYNTYNVGSGATAFDPATVVTIGGVQYYQINVDGTKASVNLSMNVSGTSTNDKTFTIQVGGKAEVISGDIDYDKGNNESITLGTVAFTVNMASSGVKLTVANVFEDNDPNQHLGQTGNTTGYTGAIKLELAGMQSGDNEYIQKVFLSITPNTEGKVMVNGVPLPADGFLSFDAQGNCTTTGFAGMTKAMLTNGTIKYVPDLDSDIDVTVNFAAAVVDPDSGDTKVVSNINGWSNSSTQGQDLVSGSVDTSIDAPAGAASGSTNKITVDAVADKPTDLTTGTVTDSNGDHVGGTGWGGANPETAKPGENVTLKITSVKFGDYADGSEKHSILVQTWCAVKYENNTSGNVGVAIGKPQDIVIKGTNNGSGAVYKQTIHIETEKANSYVLLEGPGGQLQRIGADGKDAGGNQVLDANWWGQATSGGTHTGVSGSFIKLPVLNELLQNTDGKVSTEVTVTSPALAQDGTVTIKTGGYAEETTLAGGEITTTNNTSTTLTDVQFGVGSVSAKVTVGVSNAFENADGDAHLGFVGRASMIADLKDPDPDKAEKALMHLKAGGSAITVAGITDTSEACTKAIFTVDYPGVGALFPGQFLYKDVLVDVPKVGSATIITIDGDTVTCTVNATGEVKIVIDGFDPVGSNGETNIYFIPGENYRSDDVTLDYAIVVKEGSSGHEKVFSSDKTLGEEALLPSVPHSSSDHTGETQQIEVDAVAQKVDITDITVEGLSTYNHIVPGSLATVHMDVDLHGDVTDKTENHLLYVEAKPGFAINHITITYTDTAGNPQKVTVSLAGLGLQQTSLDGFGNIADTYHTLDLGKYLPNLGKGEIGIDVVLHTPGSAGASETIKMGLSSHEDWHAIREGGDHEQLLSNNNSFTGKEVTINFSACAAPGVGVGGFIFENNNGEAHVGKEVLGVGAPLGIGTGDGNDELKSFNLSIDLTSQDLGDLVYFASEAAYNAFVDAVKGGMDPYTAALAHAQKMGDSLTFNDIKGSFADGDMTNGFGGKIIFLPSKDNYSGKDPELTYSMELKDTASGQVQNINNGKLTITSDAVAQRPEDINTTNPTGNEDLGYGETRTATITAEFKDMDSTTEHFILVEAEVGWTISYKDAGGNSVTLTTDETMIFETGGKTYFKIPVDPTPTAPGSHTGTVAVEVTFKAPTNPIFSNNTETREYEIEVKAVSIEKDTGDREVTYHNNTAVNGSTSLTGELLKPGGTWIFEQKAPLYEDNDSQQHLTTGVHTPPDAGSFLVGCNGASSAVITVPLGTDGKPLLEFSGSNVTYQGGGKYLITGLDSGTKEVSVLLSESYLKSGGANNDADILLEKVDFYSGANGTGTLVQSMASGHAHLTVLVDAVADQVDMTVSVKEEAGKGTTVIGDDAVVADINSGTDAVAKFAVTAQFTDTDGSENHYVLVEKTAQWTTAASPYAIDEVYIDGKAYYRFDVTADANSGATTFDIGMTYQADTKGEDIIATPQPGGVTNYSLSVGAMSQEKNGLDGEFNLTNNTAINVTESVTLQYSPLHSSGSLSMEHVIDEGQTATLKLSGIATGLSDELKELTITYDQSQGTLTLDGVTVVSGVKITDPAQLLALANGKGMVFTPTDHNHNDVSFSVTGVVRDKVSGASGNISGSHTLVIDAVADGSTNTIAVNDTSGNFGAVESGMSAVVTVVADFADNVNGSEDHWVVLEQKDLDYTVTGAVLIDAFGGRTNLGIDDLVTMFDQQGKPYFGVKMPGTGDYTVQFTVTTAPTNVDIDLKLNAGTITVETTKNTGGNKEPDYSDNWKSDLQEIVIHTGVVETTEVVMKTETVREDEDAQLKFTDLDLAHNESITTVVVTITGNGTIVDAAGNAVPSLGGKYTLDGAIATSGGYYFKAADNLHGDFTLHYTATVTDKASGANSEFTGTWTAKVTAVADVAENLAPDATQQEAIHVAGTHTGTVTATFTAEFGDVDGSEYHYMFVMVPAGMTMTGANGTGYSSFAVATAAEKALLGINVGDVVYKVSLLSNAGTVSINGAFTVDSSFTAGESITTWAVSQEGNGYAGKPDQYAVSSPVEVAVTLPAGGLNSGPAGSSMAQDVTISGAATSMSGTIVASGMFADAENDAVILASVSVNGTTQVIKAGDITHIEGQYGILTINPGLGGTYAYTYALKAGAVGTGNTDNFSFTAQDALGALSTANGALNFTFRDGFMMADATGGIMDASQLTEALTIHGSDVADTITGTGFGDTIYTGAGNDVVHGGAGNDVINSGAGNKLIYAGAGNDTIYGGTGDDTLYGESGNNLLYGGDGNDVIHGGTGSDTLYGDAGDDTLYVTAGNNTLYGGDGNDVIHGGTGDDTLYGDAGDDTLYATAGNNTLYGGDGNDVIHGGTGSDTLYGDAGDDTLYATAGNNTLYGGDGNDVIHGGTGSDTLYGDAGDDTLYATAGNNTLYGGDGNDVIHGGTGSDTLYGNDGTDTFVWNVASLGGADLVGDFTYDPSGNGLGDVIAFADVFGEAGAGQDAIDAMLRSGTYDVASKTFTALDTISGNGIEATFLDADKMQLTLSNGSTTLQTIMVDATTNFAADLAFMDQVQAQAILEQMIKNYTG